ncbi:hypothetical protein [Pseudoduganella sp. GCM10020061]|uniref:hypothetical protein n=1 Tax=Pseudoduganella sp. GCM10020061 TaxID=3317345 RepID=UPI0036430C05
MNTTDQHDDILQPRFAQLRGALQAHNAPPGVEKELMDVFRKQHARRRWYQRLSPGSWGLAGVGSACAAVLVLMVTLQGARPGADEALPLVYRDGGTAFIALDSLERIEAEPSPRLVEAELPGSALAEAGVPVSPETAGRTVRAEMLVTGDGEPLAVRLTSESQ